MKFSTSICKCFFKRRCSQNQRELKCWNSLLQQIAKELLHSSNFITTRIAFYHIKAVGKFFHTSRQPEVNSMLQEPGRLSGESLWCWLLYKISPAKMEPVSGHLEAFDTCKDPMHPLDDKKKAKKWNAAWLKAWSEKIKFCHQLLKWLLATALCSFSPGHKNGSKLACKGLPAQLGHFRVIKNLPWSAPSLFRSINTAFTFHASCTAVLLELLLKNCSDQTFFSCHWRWAVCFLDDNDCSLCSLTWTYSCSAHRDLIKADRPNMGRKTSLLITVNSCGGTLPAQLLSHLVYQQFFNLSWSCLFLLLTSPLLSLVSNPPSRQYIELYRASLSRAENTYPGG